MPCKTMTESAKVVEVLTNVEEYPCSAPAAARTMLADGLPHALQAGGEAHSFQKDVADLVAAMLEEVRAGAEGSLAAACDKAEEAETQRAAADGELEAAAAKAAAAKAEVDAKAAALRDAKAEVKANQELHKEAKAAEKAILKEREELSAKKEQLDGLAAALKAFEESLGEAEAPVAAVEAYLQEIHAEKALIAAVPGALQRKPAERGAFDQITMAEVDDLLAQSLTMVSAELAEGEKSEKHVTAEVLGAWAVMDLSQERQHEAAAALSTAQEAHVEAKSVQDAAHAAAKQANNAVTDALVQKTLVEEKVSEIKAAESALECLRNPPAPVEEPAEAAPMDVSEAAPAEVNEEQAVPMDTSEAKVVPEVGLSRIPEPPILGA